LTSTEFLDMEIDLRAVTASDLDVLANLVSEYYAFDDLVYDDQLARRALCELINEKEYGRIWLLELEQRPIGYLLLTFGFIVEFHGKHAVIDEVYLRPGYRSRGYFRMALAFVEAFCRESNIRCLRLEVEMKNQRAQEAYHKAGFHRHERIVMTKVLK
jgi:ribosomal protein S18 acetylase RimI-like enzyme